MWKLFDTARNQMNNWRWDNPRGLMDLVNHRNLQTTSLGNNKHNGEHVSWYGSDAPRAKVEEPSYQQYMPGDILAVRSLNWDGITDKDDDDKTWADPQVPSGGWNRPGNGNRNGDGKGGKETQVGEKGTGKWKGTLEG